MKWLILLAVSAIAGTGFVLTSGDDVDIRWPWESAPSTANDTGRQRTTKSTSPVESERPLIFANGIVEGSHRAVDLGFETVGRILAIEVGEGDRVLAGQLLARLEDDTWQARLNEARAQLALAEARRERIKNAASPEERKVARAEVRVAEVETEQTARDLDRHYELQQRQAITQQRWDEIRNEHDLALARTELARAQAEQVEAAARQDDLAVADAQIALARSEVRSAEVMLSKTLLRSPADGIILRLEAEPGELVTTDVPQPIFTMTSLDEIRVRAYVEELDAMAVRPGDRGWVTADGLPDGKFHGTIVECGPAMHPKHHFSHKPGERVDVKVREIVLRLENANELVVGLPVDVFIERNSAVAGTESRPTREPSQESHPLAAIDGTKVPSERSTFNDQHSTLSNHEPRTTVNGQPAPPTAYQLSPAESRFSPADPADRFQTMISSPARVPTKDAHQ